MGACSAALRVLAPPRPDDGALRRRPLSQDALNAAFTLFPLHDGEYTPAQVIRITAAVASWDLGIVAPRVEQVAVAATSVEGHDVINGMGTGTGKTAWCAAGGEGGGRGVASL